MQTRIIFHQHFNVITLMALQCKVMQHNNGGTVQYWQQANTNTDKFSKIVHPDFFGEYGGRSSQLSDLENQSVIAGSRL